MKLAALLSVAVLLGACATETHVAAVPTTAAPIIEPAEPSIRLLSEERCAHEAICGRVGRDRRFPTQAACLVSTLVAERQAIGPDACPFGVDDEQVKRCVATLHARMCADTIDALDDVADCRAFELCRSPP